MSPGYSYDAAGNLLSDGMHSYTYDAEGNLTQIDGGGTASYVYDALNKRVKVTANGNVQRFGFDLAGRLATTWADGNTLSEVSAKYYAGPGSKGIAYWLASDGNIHFEHGDWLGTERMRTSNSGSVEATFTSFPFGDSLAYNGPDTDPEHFAMLDQDTLAAPGLQHATFREYHATSGRWTSPDPYDGSYDISNPQSLNRYSYALNSPLSYLDPSGQYCEYGDAAGEGVLEEVDYNSSIGECDSTGGQWFPDGWGKNGSVTSGDNWIPFGGGDGGSGGSGAGTGPTAPNNPQQPKSPARQKCEADANNHFNNTTQAAKQNVGRNVTLGALIGVTAIPGASCVLAAAVAEAAGPEAVPPACLAAIMETTTPPALALEAGIGAAGGLLFTGASMGGAYVTRYQEMAACAKIP